jgi:hypothetical protein
VTYAIDYHDDREFVDDYATLDKRSRLEIERQIEGQWKTVRPPSAAHNRPLSLLRASLRADSSTREGRRLFERANMAGFGFRATTLAELAEETAVGPECEGLSAAYFAAAVQVSPTSIGRTFALVGIHRPLLRVARLCDPAGRDEEVMGEAITAALEMLDEGLWHGGRREFMKELGSRTRDQVRYRRHDGVHEDELTEETNPAMPSADPAETISDLVAWLCSQGVVSDLEAELMVRTHIWGERLDDVAHELGVPYRTLQSQRLRAEERCAGYLCRTLEDR